MGERKIDSLLEDIDLKRIALPEIQRDYVWSEQKARDLVDSLFKEFPVGVVLLWRPQSISDFRELEGQDKNDVVPDWLILDGQQRLTSLKKIAKGEIKVRFNINEEIFSLENRANSLDPNWIRVDDIWKHGATEIGKKLSEKLGISINEVFENFINSIQKIESIPKQSMNVFEFREDDYTRITEMYMRINEKGTKLKKAEINLALIVLKFPSVFHKRLTQLVDNFENWELDTNFFLRCFVCISTNQAKFEPLKKYLQTARKDDVINNLDRISDNLESTFNFLTSEFGINQDNNEKLIPSNNALVPLMMYLVKNNSKIPTQKHLEDLSRWFFCASHYGRYSSSPESALSEDLKAIQEDNALEILQSKISRDRGGNAMRELQGRINNTNKFALHYAIRKNNALDWWEGTKIENTGKIEFHHIFPKKVLRDAGYSDVLINDIRNIAIVSRKANRTISDMKPEKYFTEEVGDMNRVFSQFVPEDNKFWKVENYEEFLQEREKRIISFVNEMIS